MPTERIYFEDRETDLKINMLDEVIRKNIVKVGLMIGHPQYCALILPIASVKSEGVDVDVPYSPEITDEGDPNFDPNDHGSWEGEGIVEESILPVTLRYHKLLVDLGINLKILEEIPPHIKYLHQLQNWFYFTKGKPFIDWKKFNEEGTEEVGDFWIRTSKEFNDWCEEQEKLEN